MAGQHHLIPADVIDDEIAEFLLETARVQGAKVFRISGLFLKQIKQ